MAPKLFGRIPKTPLAAGTTGRHRPQGLPGRVGQVGLLLLLSCFLGLVPLASATPPDPSWIEGVYDEADYDDVVLLAVSIDGTRDFAPLIVLSPIPLVLGLVHPADLTGPAGLSLPAVQIRAPPGSPRAN